MDRRKCLLLVAVPLLLLSSAFALEFPNRVTEEPKVDCSLDDIKFQILTESRKASKIFVKGFSKTDGCFHENVNNAEFKLTACNANRRRKVAPVKGVEYTMTIVVQLHPMFITQVDRAYFVRCFYMETEKTLSLSLDVKMLTTELVEASHAMPQCVYGLHQDSADGPAVRFARVGEQVWHVWHCPSDVYGMLVHSCVVTDNQGSDVRVLDEQGCGIDETIFPTPEYSEDMTRVQQLTHVFKFADKVTVAFNCQIRLCFRNGGSCDGVTPPRCDKKARLVQQTQENTLPPSPPPPPPPTRPSPPPPPPPPPPPTTTTTTHDSVKQEEMSSDNLIPLQSSSTTTTTKITTTTTTEENTALEDDSSGEGEEDEEEKVPTTTPKFGLFEAPRTRRDAYKQKTQNVPQLEKAQAHQTPVTQPQNTPKLEKTQARETPVALAQTQKTPELDVNQHLTVIDDEEEETAGNGLHTAAPTSKSRLTRGAHQNATTPFNASRVCLPALGALVLMAVFVISVLVASLAAVAICWRFKGRAARSHARFYAHQVQLRVPSSRECASTSTASSHYGRFSDASSISPLY